MGSARGCRLLEVFKKTKMTNSKHLIHRTLDIGSGLILAVIIQILVFPLYDIHINIWEMFHLSLIFMVVSIARSYLWSKYIFKYK